MRKNVVLFSVLLTICATARELRADPVTLTFDLHITEFAGRNPELALGVFGEMPEVGSTMRAVALMNQQDVQPLPGFGGYLSPSWTDAKATSLRLTVGSSTLPVMGGAELLVGNNQPGFGDHPVDLFFYELKYGRAPTVDGIYVSIEGWPLPGSTFTSEAIPPPSALQSGLLFRINVLPKDYTCDVEDCAAFYLNGAAQAVEDPAPVPEPASMVLVGGGLLMIAARLRASRRWRSPISPIQPRS